MIIVKIFALTYALIPSLYFKADFRIIRGQRIFLVGKLSFKRIA